MIKRFMALAVILAGLTVNAQEYARSVHYADIELRPWTCVSNFAATTTTGTLTGAHYYRVSGTNLGGRIPATEVTNLTCTTNGVVLRWKRKDGLHAYIVEHSTDGATWAQWKAVSILVTNFTDSGATAWTSGAFTSAVPAIALPTLVGVDFLTSNSVDNVTIQLINGKLTATGTGAVVSAFGAITGEPGDNAALARDFAAKVSTNDARYLASLTNAAAFDAAGSAGSVSQQVWAAFGGSLTNATGGILSLIGRQIGLTYSALTNALAGAYAGFVHGHVAGDVSGVATGLVANGVAATNDNGMLRVDVPLPVIDPLIIGTPNTNALVAHHVRGGYERMDGTYAWEEGSGYFKVTNGTPRYITMIDGLAVATFSETDTHWTNTVRGTLVGSYLPGATGYDAPAQGMLVVSYADSRLAADNMGLHLYRREIMDAGGWSGLDIVEMDTNQYTIAIDGPATAGDDGAYWLLTNSATWYAGTGTLTITSAGQYIVGLEYDQSITPLTPLIPGFLVMFEETRISATEIQLSARCDMGGAESYYAAISNLVVLTWSYPDVVPGSITNDAPGMVVRVDDAPAGDARRIVNRGTLERYVASQSTNIAASAWDWTPGGARRPTRNVCVIDRPMVQQGDITYMQAGGYYCQSASGDQYVSVTTGSTWRIGPAGHTYLEIGGTNKLLMVSGFSVSGGVASFSIATNGVVGDPVIETCDLLAAANPIWLLCPDQVVTDNGTNWTATCDASATQRWFRAVSPGGDALITSHVRHHFAAGVSGDGSGLTNLPATSMTSGVSASNITASTVGGTCTITRAMGPYLYVEAGAPLTLTVQSADWAATDYGVFALSVYSTGQVTFLPATMTNQAAASWSALATNNVLFFRGVGDVLWRGR